MTTTKEEKKQTGIRLPADLIKRLKHLSLDMDRTYTSLIAEAVEEFLQKHEKKK